MTSTGRISKIAATSRAVSPETCPSSACTMCSAGSSAPRLRGTSISASMRARAHVCLGVRSHPLEHPDRYVLQLLATVLGGGMSSRLFTEVRERRGLAYYVYGLNHSYTDAGLLYSQAGVDIERIDEAVTTIGGESQAHR